MERKSRVGKLLILNSILQLQDHNRAFLSSSIINSFASFQNSFPLRKTSLKDLVQEQLIVDSINDLSTFIFSFFCARFTEELIDSTTGLNSSQRLLRSIRLALETLRQNHICLIDLRNYNSTAAKEEIALHKLNIELIRHILSNSKFDIATKHSAEQISTLREQTTMVNAKLNALRLEFLTETYTEVSVSALHNLREGLENAIQRKRSEILNAEQQLSTYRSAGLDFMNIAKEYSKLMKLEANKLWGLKQIELSQEERNRKNEEKQIEKQTEKVKEKEDSFDDDLSLFNWNEDEEVVEEFQQLT